jgi:hypothetical protein
MPLEAIYKFQPNRILYLRGSDGFGANASLCNATSNSFDVYGVFRDQGDFTVLMIWDQDNQYENYLLRYLPDSNVSGVSLSFDVQYGGIQPFDSARYSWIGWAQIQTIQEDGTSTANIYLFDHATLISNPSTTFNVASGSFTFTNPSYGDNVYIIVNNVTFLYQDYTYGVDTAASVAAYLAEAINNHDWSTYFNADIAVVGTASGATLQIQYGRTGTVRVSGITVTWTAGTKFPGLKAGDSINIGANVGNTVVGGNLQYTVAAVNSPTSLTLSRSYSGSGSTGLSYTSTYGGVDGNELTIYALLNPANTALSVSPLVLPLTGGTSFDAVWNISVAFSTYGITALRQAWFTFAPALADGAAYADTEWSAVFTNWTVTDPDSVTPLQCAGPGSVRVGCYDAWTTFSGPWDNQDGNNNTYLGRAKSITASDTWVTTEPSPGVFDTSHTLTIASNSITIQYDCDYTHDLYLGTFLYVDRGIVAVSIDGGTASSLDCYLNTGAPFPARRLIQGGIAAGSHTVTISLTGFNTTAFNDSQSAAGSGSFPFYYWHDFLEAAVPSDIPSISEPTYLGSPKISPALDYDTDQTYKLSPARIMWQLSKLGFTGDIDFYIGVFYWPNRIRGTNAAFGESIVVFSGTFVYGDVITLTIGGTPYLKYVRDFGESLSTIAAHFAYYINSGSVGVWAAASGGTLTITVRSTGSTYVYAVTVSTALASGSAGAATVSSDGTNSAGTEGDWIVNTGASNFINYPARQFMTDLFAQCAASSLNCVAAFSMELVNPPDYSTSPISSPGIWQARFADGSGVKTDTDLSYNGNLLSSFQCAPMSALTAYQESLYVTVAGLQTAASLTPWLQFGEFLWWFFSRLQNVAAGYVAYTSPISIGLADPHGFSSGDRVIVSGVEGMTSANGTWTITVTDATHFTLNGSTPNGAWVFGSGYISGGGMAFFDSLTTAAAATALGHTLTKFTCQDDDPAAFYGGADASFLAARLKAHVDGIRSAVLGVYPSAKFELLFPDDVNHPSAITTAAIPYPQGGRLNAAVNLPAQWSSPSTSGLDRIKIECLSWGSQYRSLVVAQSSMARFPNYPASQLAYLVPVFNGGCPWKAEFLAAVNTLSFALICFWAWDQFQSQSFPLPLPVNASRVGSS